MKQKYTMVSLFILILISHWAFALETPVTSATTSTDDRGKNIQGTNASGNQQTTIIDESGNLKVIDKNAVPTPPSNPPVVSTPPTSPMPMPSMISPPIDSNLNANPHIVVPGAPHQPVPQSPGTVGGQ